MQSKSWRYEHVTLDRVIDGDTLDVIIDVGFRFTTRQRLRLLELDTPERGEPLWREATEQLRALLAGQPIAVTTVKQDGFGRWLAHVEVNGQDVSTLMRDWLTTAAHGVPYCTWARSPHLDNGISRGKRPAPVVAAPGTP